MVHEQMEMTIVLPAWDWMLLGLLALFGYVVIVWLIGRAVGYSAAENEALFLPKTEDRE